MVEAGQVLASRDTEMGQARVAVGHEAAPDPRASERRSLAARLAGDRGREQPVRLREADPWLRGGREIRAFKDQLSRLSAAIVRLAVDARDIARIRSTPRSSPAFDLWPEKDERQRVLWPSTIQLSLDYFASLQEHAVPLNEADLAALAHSAMALDLYAWLAQRLHRMTPMRPAFITWAALKQQFGPDYGRMSHFKRDFRTALRQVRARYDRARIDLDERGITLHHSLPPVTKRQVMLPPKSRT